MTSHKKHLEICQFDRVLISSYWIKRLITRPVWQKVMPFAVLKIKKLSIAMNINSHNIATNKECFNKPVKTTNGKNYV